jgi:hypothetical protein
MNSLPIPFIHFMTLGQVATCYSLDRKTFKEMIRPLIDGKLSYLKDGSTRKISPGDQKMIADFLGNHQYLAHIPKLTLKFIAKSYNWTVEKLNKNTFQIQNDLKKIGFAPRKAMKPMHARVFYDHLGIPEDETILNYFEFY